MILDLLHILFNVVTPVAVCAAIGYGWSRTGQPFDKAMVAKLVMNIGVPCLVFAALVSADLDPDEFFDMAAASLTSTVLFLIGGWGLLKLFRLPVQTYLNALAFPNTGNMALPLCLLAFGDRGLALGISYFCVNVVLVVTIGVAIASNRYRPLDVLRQPFIYAAAAAAFFMISGVPVPEAVQSTTKLLGNFSIPLMLITLGVSLQQLRVGNAGRSLLVAILRLGGGIAGGFAVAALFGFDGPQRGVLVLMCAMPVAVVTYLLAETHGGEGSGSAIAGAVIFSTLLSFLTLPGLIWFLVG